MLQDKKILLGITGSIAAYKSILLTRLLVQAGADVKVIITPAARDFVSPLTLSTLSHNKVLSALFEEDSWSNHVMLGRWADLMLVAPATGNSIAKMAAGLCDNLLLATYLSATCPVLVAPAMDEDMWHHPAMVRNLDALTSFGNLILPVGKGELASGLIGDGRMAEPENIINVISDTLSAKRDLAGKKVLITAGPTYESIDPVRYITNHSSGKMGFALAADFARRGADVHVVSGPTQLTTQHRNITVTTVRTAAQMCEACEAIFDSVDIAVMAAAVADYTPVAYSPHKVKKQGDNLVIELTRTKDILKSLGQQKIKQVLVGFALETNNEREFALQKLISKNADMIVLNSLNDAGAGFGHDTNKITVFHRSGAEVSFDTKSKSSVAKDIVDLIVKMLP